MKPKIAKFFYDRFKFDTVCHRQNDKGFPTYAVGVRKDDKFHLFFLIQEEGKKFTCENHLGGGEKAFYGTAEDVLSLCSEIVSMCIETGLSQEGQASDTLATSSPGSGTSDMASTN
jgi:hypothetical protein